MSKFLDIPTKKEINNFFPICNLCKHHIDGIKCKAFEMIPDRIIFGDNDHSKPLPEQNNNIVFEPIKDEPKK